MSQNRIPIPPEEYLTSEISIQVDPKYLSSYFSHPQAYSKKSPGSRHNMQPLRQKCISIDSNPHFPHLTDSKSIKSNNNVRTKGPSHSPPSQNLPRSSRSIFTFNPPGQKPIEATSLPKDISSSKSIRRGLLFRHPSSALFTFESLLESKPSDYKSPVKKIKSIHLKRLHPSYKEMRPSQLPRRASRSTLQELFTPSHKLLIH